MAIMKRRTKCHVCDAFPVENEFYYLGTRFYLCDAHYLLELKKEDFLFKAGMSDGENFLNDEKYLSQKKE